MASRNYSHRPYQRGGRKKNNKIIMMLILLVVLVLVIIAFKSCQKSTDEPQTVIEQLEQTKQTQQTQQVPQTQNKEIPAMAQRKVLELPGVNSAAKPEPQKTVVQPAQSVQQEVKPQEPTPVVAVTETPKAVAVVPEIEDQATVEKLRQIDTQAQAYIANNQIIEARDLLNETLKLPLTAKQRNDLKKTLTLLADKWLFSKDVLSKDTVCSYQVVQPGQVLATIGKKYDVPWQFLLRINGMEKPESLWAGAKIKVVQGPFNLKIYRSTFTMDLFVQGKFVKSYKVALGRIGTDGNPTPTGLWKVKGSGKGKLKRPPWPDPATGKLVYYEDPNYPLGERWIGLDGVDGLAKDRTGFGIHGTNKPETIGTYASDGCIRMLNDEVIELWDIVSENTTEVLVVD